MKHDKFMATSILASILNGNISVGSPPKPPPRKCLLRDCQKTTTHNGGYCSAAHCKLDRARSKQK